MIASINVEIDVERYGEISSSVFRVRAAHRDGRVSCMTFRSSKDAAAYVERLCAATSTMVSFYDSLEREAQ